MIIYKATNIKNNKVYIGQTVRSLKIRKGQHKCLAESKKVNYYFANAIQKYGIKNFIWEEIDTAITLDELNKKEIYWINYYNSYNKKFGYNLTNGGCCADITQRCKSKMKLTNHPAWKKDLDSNFIIKLRFDGFSLDKIAEKANCSRRAIENHLREALGEESLSKNFLKNIRLDKSKEQYTRPLIKADDKKIIKMYQNNISVKEISNIINMSESAIFRRLKKNNIPLKRKMCKRNSISNKQIIELKQRNLTIEQIAIKLQMTANNVRRRLRIIKLQENDIIIG